MKLHALTARHDNRQAQLTATSRHKKLAAALLAACLTLLTACAGTGDARGSALAAEVYQLPVYSFDTMTAEERFTAEDGTELAYYSYQLQSMAVENLKKLSPEDREAAERNAENFNEKMNDLLDKSVEIGRQMGANAQTVPGSAGLPYYDVTVSESVLCGQIVSVRMDNTSYSGGAHPNSYTNSYLFDLATGQFIDPIQVADDPETFRAGAADLLVEAAEAREEDLLGYWPDYRGILERWNEGAALFGPEGLTVVYSPYELGPYAMGAVELAVPYGELADLLGPGGLERLGLKAETEETEM